MPKIRMFQITILEINKNVATEKSWLRTLTKSDHIVGIWERTRRTIKKDLNGAQLQEQKKAAHYGALKTTLETSIAEMQTSLDNLSMEKANSPIVSHWKQPCSHESLLDDYA